MHPIIYLISFFSGVSGLIYQVIWVREFGQIFGNTVQSAALVSGTFVFGLGVGSYLAGRWIDRIHRVHPLAGLVGYAYAEFGVALLGLALAVFIPRLEALSPLISQYAVGYHGWMELTALSYVWRYLIALVLVGPITVLMGATLTLLIRYLLRASIGHAGWKIGVLYGINTLGAAAGCALVDLWAIPALGLAKTKLVAVALNFLCGASVLLLIKRGFAETLPTPVEEKASARVSVLPLSFAIAISGFAAMGMEIVWFRFLKNVYTASHFTFSILLSVLLTGVWLGSVLSGYISRRYRNSARLYVYAQLLFAAAVIGGFYFFNHSTRVYFSDDLYGPGGPTLPISFIDFFNVFVSAGKTLFVPSIFMGFAYPLMNDLVQTKVESVGRDAGLIYLWNAGGAVVGSILTGFVLIPWLGIQNSIALLVIAAALAALPIFFSFRLRLLDYRLHVSALAFLVATGYWFTRPVGLMARGGQDVDAFGPVDDKRTEQEKLNKEAEQDIFGGGKKKLLKVSEGINEVALVTENPGQVENEGRTLTLFTNGHTMSSTRYMALRYQRAFAHLPLLQMDNPTSAMVICFGVGNTLQAASLHPSIKNLEIVDLSKNVLSLAPYFKYWNRDVLESSRVHVFINDGRQHLRTRPENSFDLITLEPPPLIHAGVASLYSEEFYRLANRALKPGGYLTQWLPMNQVSGEDNKRLIKAFLDVFPNAVLLNGAFQEFILMGQKGGPNQMDWAGFQKRLASRSAVQKELKDINLSEPTEWLGTFTASSSWLTAQLKDTKPMTDDDPSIEYSPLEMMTKLPPELFHTASLGEWCPSCFAGTQLVEGLADLGRYLYVLQGLYQSEEFTFVTPERTNNRPYFFLPIARDPQVRIPASESWFHPSTMDETRNLLIKYRYIEKMFGPDFKTIYRN